MKRYNEIVRDIFDNEFLNAFIHDTHEPFNAAIRDKEAHQQIWQQLVADLRLIKNNVWLRDAAGAAAPWCNKVFIGFDQGQHGVILNISYISRMIGFYYSHFQMSPVIDVSSKTASTHRHVSYYPYNNDQELLTIELIDITRKYFTDFPVFNNIYASQKFNNVVVNDTIYNSVDCFQLHFGDDIIAIH
jgi:hypothetical protein